MKKLTVILMLAAFAMVTTMQAGEKTEKAKATTACSAEVKASCSTQTACCATKSASAKSAKLRHSMKGATLLARL